jgi:hypothetical protein
MNETAYKLMNIRLLVNLMHIEPLIWRRILVPHGITLAQLHKVIQAAMGWENSHLHEFRIDGNRYGVPDEGFEDPSSRVHPEDDVRLHDVLDHKEQTFTYVYDFGDDWHHELVVEEILETESDRCEAYCLDGARNCPPEDIGGPFNYPEILTALSDPKHEGHDHYTEWMGDDFDPEAFDPVSINNKLEFMAAHWRTLSDKSSRLH